jgi:hypothetical protein
MAISTHKHMKQEDTERTYYRNGRVFQEVPFAAGKINGVIREWHRNGVLAKEVPMRNGVRHGECKQWNEKGVLLGSFEMGRGTGNSKHWFPNGKLAFEASVVNEGFTGRLRRWNDAGALVQENFFLENRRVPRDEYDRATETDSSLPTYDDESKEPVRERRNTGRGGHEKIIAGLLSRRTANAVEWLKESASDATRSLGELNNSKSVLLVNALREAGAVDVLAVDIDEDAKGNQQAGKLVIVMPKDQKKRRAIREKCARRKIVFSPENETGQSHLAVILS